MVAPRLASDGLLLARSLAPIPLIVGGNRNAVEPMMTEAEPAEELIGRVAHDAGIKYFVRPLGGRAVSGNLPVGLVGITSPPAVATLPRRS